MWSKERWESRWRVPILDGTGWALAALYPLVFRLIGRAPAAGMPVSVLPLLRYPHFAYTWFGEDLPELLLVYVVIWAVASIAREWQSGTVEFLAQLPLKPSQIAWQKGLWGTGEIICASVGSSAVLWVSSLIAGHRMALGPYVLSVLLMTMGFVGILWLVSALAWALHGVYAVILVGLAIFAVSVTTKSIPPLKRFSPLTYISNTSPHPLTTRTWEHLAIISAVTVGLVLLSLWVAGRQEFVPHHGRDQI